MPASTIPSGAKNGDGAGCCNHISTAHPALRFLRDASHIHPLPLFLISLVTVAGLVCMVLGLNFWLHSFKRGPFTTAAVVAVTWDIVLIALFGTWLLTQRSSLAFLGRVGSSSFLRTMALLAVIGSLEAAAGLVQSYAAEGTPEALQGILGATVVPLTAVFAAFLIPVDQSRVSGATRRLRQLLSPTFIGAMVLVAASVLVLVVKKSDSKEHHVGGGGEGRGNQSITTTTTTTPAVAGASKSLWPLVYFIGSVFNALHFVLQGRFMLRHTVDPLALAGGGDGQPTGSSATLGGDDSARIWYPEESVVSSARGSSSSPQGRAILWHNDSSRLPSRDTRDDFAAGVQQGGTSEVVGEYGETRPLIFADVEDARRLAADADGVGASTMMAHPSPAGDVGAVGYLGSGSSARGDDTTVKLAMLAIDTFYQVVFTFLCLPMDAIPGYGKSATVADSARTFSDGIHDVLSDSHGDTRYFGIFVMGFAVSHVAFAYLNHYSPAFTPIVMLMASPVTGLLLLVVPAWDVQGAAPQAWRVIVATAGMVGASVLFAIYESTRRRR